jgi:predicted DNA-binding transcriptional regulator AlpA
MLESRGICKMLKKLQGFLSERELSELTGIKVNTLQRWRLLGKGPRFLKLGGAVRYDPKDVDVWLEECRAAGQREAVGA